MEEIHEFSDLNPGEEEADDAETANLISRRLSVLEEVRFLIVYDFKLYVALVVTMIQAHQKKNCANIYQTKSAEKKLQSENCLSSRLVRFGFDRRIYSTSSQENCAYVGFI